MSDPAGSTTYAYAIDVFGRLGEPTTITRSFGAGGSVVIRREHDLDGLLLHEDWTGGVSHDVAYSETRWPARHTVGWPGGTAEVDPTYDAAWGLPTGFAQVGGGFAEARTWSTPTRLADIGWSHAGVGVGSLDYDWSDQGLLVGRSIGQWSPIRYAYDDQQRVASLALGPDVLEGYTYDPAGNLVTMERDGEAWTCDLILPSAGADHPSHVAGRGWHVTLDRDADGNVVEMAYVVDDPGGYPGWFLTPTPSVECPAYVCGPGGPRRPHRVDRVDRERRRLTGGARVDDHLVAVRYAIGAVV